ncbi:MAG TPA: lipid-transfer protein [Acidimicrobiia bacterium]|nr:lipid-transfer protein [Acidimicrobiia bacterium]
MTPAGLRDGITVAGHRDRCAISGIGATGFSSNSGRSTLSLAVEASLAAVADAGLRPSDVDGVVRCDMDAVAHNDLAEALGLPDVTYWGSSGPGGAAPGGMIGQAVGAVLSGQATTVLAFRSLNGRSGARFGRSGAVGSGGGGGAGWRPRAGGRGTYDEFFFPYGLVAPGQLFSLLARRHMIEFGTTGEQLGHIALACRARANANPAAQMADRPLTMEDYLSARMISSPLRLFDYCLETDGACAVVVTSAARAADGPQPPALIRAVAQSAGPEPQLGFLFPTLLRDSLTTQTSKSVADVLYRRAGLGPGDVDVAQFYDCFTITVLLQLEDYGFCAKGEGGPFAASGAIDKGGSLPINTSGGHLSEGYIHGLNHIVEGVRQIRGTSTSQVPGAEVCLVTSGLPVTSSALVLRRAS